MDKFIFNIMRLAVIRLGQPSMLFTSEIAPHRIPTIFGAASARDCRELNALGFRCGCGHFSPYRQKEFMGTGRAYIAPYFNIRALRRRFYQMHLRPTRTIWHLGGAWHQQLLNLGHGSVSLPPVGSIMSEPPASAMRKRGQGKFRRRRGSFCRGLIDWRRFSIMRPSLRREASVPCGYYGQ